MKKIIAFILLISLVFTYCPSVFADDVPDRYDNVIYSQDFSDFKYSVNDFDSVYKGRYIVLSATAENGALSVKNGNRFIYETHELTERRMISGGVIKIEADFVFTDLSKGAKIMATYKNGGSSDGDATGCAYMLRSTSDKTVILKAYDKNGNAVTHIIDKSIETNKKYTYAIYMDLDSGRIQAQAGGANVLMGEELYMSKDLYTKNENSDFSNANINRLFETRSDSGGEYTVDNIKITKEAKLPVSNHNSTPEELFSDDFDPAVKSGYAAAVNIDNNLIDFSTIAQDSENHKNVLNLSEARLTKDISSITANSGIYSVKTDMYFTDFDGNWFAALGIANTSSVTVARLRFKGQNVYLQQGNSDVGSPCIVEAGKWYTFEIIFDTTTGDVSALVDGTVFASTKMSQTLDMYGRVNNDLRSVSDVHAYMDNLVISKIYPSVSYVDASYYKTDIVNENFDSGTFGEAYTNLNLVNPVLENGTLKFDSGKRMIKNHTATDGVYVIDLDVLISDFGTNKKYIFGPSGWAESGYQHLFDIYSQPVNEQIGKIGIRAFNKQGQNSDVNDIVTDLKENELINIKVAFDIDSGRIHTYVNGIETLVDRELYCFNWDNGETEEKEQIKITRIYDFDNRTSSVKYTIDNLRAYRDIFSESVDIESGLISGKTINLPKKIGDNNLYWYSHSELITIEDYVATVTLGTNSTAKYPEIEVITEDEYGKFSKTYTFYLPANTLDLSGIPSETKEHINNLPFITGDGMYLINWTTSHPEIITNTGAVTRPEDTTTVTLTANYSEIEASVDVKVLGMNTEDKIFVTNNKLYANDVLVTGKSNINGKTVKFEGNIHNATSDAINVTPIIAIYDSVGDLDDVVVGTKQTIASKTSGTKMELTYDIPQQDGYTVKAMIWNMDTLKPYSIATNTDDKKANLYILAASTYANYADDAPQNQAGIGMYLGNYLDENITVVNKAIGGRSSRSFLKEGDFNKYLALAKEGDYTLISFGGNDTTVSRPERYVSKEDFPKFLDVYYRATTDRGIIPFFAGNTYHGKFNTTDANPTSVTYDSIYEEYNDVMKTYTTSNNIPMVDIYTAHGKHLATLKPDEVRAEFIFEYSNGQPNNSFVHFNKTSANNMAKILSGLIKEANINGLSGYVKE